MSKHKFHKINKKEIRGIVGFSGLAIGAWLLLDLHEWSWWIFVLISIYVLLVLREKNGKWEYW